ncbi:di-heme oxidoredictase family protein [Marinicellulosiphila megalodicopiae]|uniref:di-heme oxidoredictase family protein n=1 Tax=Marinicellulosiphila megalodicopiae TaxID=2724896 RepID=UPI003BAF3159
MNLNLLSQTSLILATCIVVGCTGANNVEKVVETGLNTATQTSTQTTDTTQTMTESDTQTITLTDDTTQTEEMSDTQTQTEVQLPPTVVFVPHIFRVEVEDYINYFDADDNNIGGDYREDGVDIGVTTDVGGGYYVGWTNPGEWLEFDMELQKGEYEITARVATAVGDTTFRLQLNNSTIANGTTVNTGGWHTWEDLSLGTVKTVEGEQTLRLEFTSAQTNINWIEFNLLPPPADTDQDGVSDEFDLCPNTPYPLAVYDDGCKYFEPVAEVDVNNNILVGGAGSLYPGHTLYVFENDAGLQASQCNDTCAQTWPPVLVDDRLASGVLGLDSIERDDGTQQVTYLGQPLYFYSNDSTITDINGNSGLWSTVDVSKVGLIQPLYNSQTVLESATQYETDTALITRFSDRGRDRHAKENHFQAYDHFLTFYWKKRTISVELIDEVAKGGTTIRMNVRSQGKLDDLQAENRWWYLGKNTLAEYCGNGGMIEQPELHDLENEIYYYYKEDSKNCRENFRDIQIGDLMEFEISQFLDKEFIEDGRDNYYGTTYLYKVGFGLVPWETIQTGPFVSGVELQRDSVEIPQKAWLGGDTTIHAQETAEFDGHYMQMATNLGYENGQPFVEGRRVHHTSFTDGSHNESDENGIWDTQIGKSGNNYVNDRCANCHVRNGAAAPVEIGETLDKWVFKVGDENGNPDPLIGRVLQSRTTNATSEGDVSIASWTEENGLRSPNYQFSNGEPVQFSARISPRLVGLGLLEAIDENTILSFVDVQDLNNDGISGKVSISTHPVTGEKHIGRFGWKAGTSSVKHQVAGAFNTDMGVTSSWLPDHDCGSLQENCGQSGTEVSDEDLDSLTRYISLLGIRPQRNYNDATVIAGEELFTQIGCADCHVSEIKTGQFHPFAELRNQTIKPYTDLLLHDMGAGLADNLAEGNATGAEWRTTPLWGLGTQACVIGGDSGENVLEGGLTEEEQEAVEVPAGVDGPQVCVEVHAYLHDGRARSIEEAILWHGGESQASNDNYQALSNDDKNAMLKFLNSL